ncbi:hypothetical protein OS493_005827 [Desmophyllum pertusum]|uniref:Calponin-homology (CH) domain-containing protein n=1 Tax=Desmophyllum pertusum TaxID=174260 RepID=A0A9X0CIB2_9CNID|nr:hypothetical protein OS493_005827 [Desmophyllum pertusum]
MLEPSSTPSKENCPLLNNVHSKRAQWYSPCKNSPKIPLSPEPDAPTLKLTHFATIPKISFGTVKVGSSKTEPFVVFNPHALSQTLAIEKCPTDKGFTLDLSGNSENSEENFVSIPPNDEVFLSIKWEPKESGSCREIVRFKWDDSLRLQVVVFGTALGPKKVKSAPKRSFKKPQINKKIPKAVLQPSQVPNTCDAKTNGITVFENINSDKFASENIPLENLSEENLRRDTYLVKSKAKPQPSCKIKLNPSTPKIAKLTSKPVAVKAKKIVVSKKKLSPASGIFKKKPKPKMKLKVAAKGIPQENYNWLKLLRASSFHGIQCHLQQRTCTMMRDGLKNKRKNYLFFYHNYMYHSGTIKGFTKWLNFVLTPHDVTDSNAQADSNKGNVVLGGAKDVKKSQPLAPTREVLSFRAYTARRKMARLRRCACLLYQSEPLGHIIRKIEAEVENGRLAIRPDKKLHADLGIKRQVVDMILSYNTLWLRIGLETIFGEILPIHSNNDVTGLTRFLTDRLLGNPDIASAFVHPQVPGLYREGYVEQLGKFTLKKFLLLVLFLDCAKLTRLIDHDPCLFNKEASFKSSRSLLLTFSREYLKGEGDVTKHLNFLGYSVTHSQRAIDEVDYAVKNIAIDLRDGLRLTRVAELLTQDWKLSASLRVPAISRLQKIHNVDVFMNALKARGVLVGGVNGGVIDARHVVDGHREKTLALLWQIIFHFQVNVLLSEKLLKEEIAHLETTRRLRVQLTAADNWTDADFAGKRRDSSDLYFQSDRLRLLFKWCKMVCRLYDLKIENFTVSFSDGRALCYLLHHYHPSLLPRSIIKQQTSLTCNPGVHDASDSEGEEGVEVNSWTATFSPGSGTNTLLEELKNNERENFRTMAEKVKELGGVPLMTKASDMSYTIPDEKVVITYVAYLCARLLDLREETKAARCIQMAWRRHRLKRQLERKKNVARIVVFVQARARAAIARRRFQAMRQSAVLIQSVYRGHLVRQQLRARHQAARCIQTRYLAFRKGREVMDWYTSLRQTVVRLQAIVLANQRKRQAERNRAAKLVQAAWRGYEARRQFVEQRAACVKIQAFIRAVTERRRFLRLQSATVLIQKIYRASMSGRKERERYLHLRKCTIVLQSFFRGERDRRLVRQIRAAIKIQSHVRAWQTRARFVVLKQATTKIQAYIRMYQEQRRFAVMKNATRILQVYFRAALLGRQQKIEYESQKAACIKIQSLFRCYLQRKAFLKKREASVRIQSLFRKYLAQKRYQKLVTSTLTIQRRFRELLCAKSARQNFIRTKLSVVKIQSCYRGYRCRKQFTRVRQATVTLQSHTRGFLSRKKFLAFKHASAVIQTRYRALLQGRRQRIEYHGIRLAIVRLQAVVRRKSAIRIQASFRQYIATKRYRQIKTSAMVIQQRYRSVLLTRSHVSQFQRVRSSVVKIQSCYRGYRCRKQFIRVKQATVTLQSHTRSFLSRKKFLAFKHASAVIQTRYRALLQGRRQRIEYQRMRHAIVRLQAVVRGNIVRGHLMIQHRSAIRIQASFRQYLATKRYHQMKTSATVIQQRYRSVLLTRSHVSQFQRVRSSVVKIQSCYRGYRCRKQFTRVRQATVTLQSHTRSFLSRKKFLAFKHASAVIQTRYRALLQGRRQRIKYHRMRHAIVRLQAVVRGNIVRGHLMIQHRSAIQIQASFRQYLATKRYRQLKSSATVIQQRYRSVLLTRSHVAQFQRVRSSVKRIQAHYRGYRARRSYRILKAAVVLQSAVRGWQVRKDLKHQHVAATVIQTFYRSHVSRTKYQSLRHAAIVSTASLSLNSTRP